MSAVRVLFFIRRTLLSTDWTEQRDPGAALRFRLTFDPGTSCLLEKFSSTCKRRWDQALTTGECYSVNLRCMDSRVKENRVGMRCIENPSWQTIGKVAGAHSPVIIPLLFAATSY